MAVAENLIPLGSGSGFWLENRLLVEYDPPDEGAMSDAAVLKNLSESRSRGRPGNLDTALIAPTCRVDRVQSGGGWCRGEKLVSGETTFKTGICDLQKSVFDVQLSKRNSRAEISAG
jgi:hypothetical protein